MNMQPQHGQATAALSDFDKLKISNDAILLRGREIQAKSSTVSAFEYLRSKNVDEEVICFTLLESLNSAVELPY